MYLSSNGSYIYFEALNKGENIAVKFLLQKHGTKYLLYFKATAIWVNFLSLNCENGTWSIFQPHVH
jgi:hypothetical protein